jgi:hypothetical protein
MTRQPVRESDLRSLERARMYTIFAPLDANEPLPRELVMAARRHRTLGRWELAGALWLPALFVNLLLAAWVKVPPAVALAAIGLTFAGLLGYAVAGDRRPGRK